jgi:hypothetical protein
MAGLDAVPKVRHFSQNDFRLAHVYLIDGFPLYRFEIAVRLIISPLRPLYRVRVSTWFVAFPATWASKEEERVVFMQDVQFVESGLRIADGKHSTSDMLYSLLNNPKERQWCGF